jgi:hypothetical protein
MLDRTQRVATVILTTLNNTACTEDGFPRELGQGMHEGGHTRRPYVPRYTRVGRDALGRGRGRRARKSRPSQGTRSRTWRPSLDAHYLGMTTKLPVSAVAKLERAAAATGTDANKNWKTIKPFHPVTMSPGRTTKSLVGAQGLEPWTRWLRDQRSACKSMA